MAWMQNFTMLLFVIVVVPEQVDDDGSTDVGIVGLLVTIAALAVFSGLVAWGVTALFAWRARNAISMLEQLDARIAE